MKKKLALVFAALLFLAGASASQPISASAAALICVYLTPPQYGVTHAGYYYISPEYPGKVFGACSPKK